MRRSSIFLLLCFLPFPPFSLAHHGKDFLLIATSRTPHEGELFATLSSHYESHSSQMSLEPGLLIGVMDFWSSELHLHVDQLTEAPTFESIGLEQRFHLGRFDREFPVDIGTMIEFEKGLTYEAHDHIEWRGLLAHSGRTMDMAVNIITVQTLEKHAQTLLSYGFGVKRSFGNVISVGLELGGNLRDLREVVVTPVFSLDISDDVNIRIGSSIDTGPNKTPGTVLRASLLIGL